MADVSVRPARPADARAVAELQVATWRTAYRDLLPLASLELDVPDLAAVWARSIGSPPTPRHRLLLAVEGAEIVGMAASEPADEGAELTALLVEPRWGRRGHGSRLLAATVDHWRQDGVLLGTTWVIEQDLVLGAFLESAGWGPETVGRTLDAAGEAIRQRRWHTAL